jgi:hypothetical protein
MAYHFHWSRDEIMELPHKERHRWVREISEINRKINEGAGVAATAAPGGGSVALPSQMGIGGFGVDLKSKFMQDLLKQSQPPGEQG